MERPAEDATGTEGASGFGAWAWTLYYGPLHAVMTRRWLRYGLILLFSVTLVRLFG